MDTNTIAMIILFATFMIFMVLRVPVTFSMLGACVMTALYLGPKYVSSVFLRLGDGVQSFSFLAIPFFIFAGVCALLECIWILKNKGIEGNM